MQIFTFSRYIAILFFQSCVNLYSFQQCKKVLIVPHRHQNVAFTLFFILAILVDISNISLYLHIPILLSDF